MKSTISTTLRDAPWLSRRRLAVYPKLFVIGFSAAFAAWIFFGHGLLDPAGKPIGPDFINFYAASAQALAGHTADAYDVELHGAAERAALGGHRIDVHLFDYPPTFLLIILPLALLPYLWSLLAWTIATTGGFIAMIRRIAPTPQTLWIAAAFPGIWINALSGQNASLTALLLGGGLMMLDKRPMLAGVLCGLLTYKPHLALLVLIVLPAAGRWRAAFAATVAAVTFAGAALIAFGIDSWRGFFRVGSIAQHLILGEGANPYAKQQTLFAALRFANVPMYLSYAVQAVFSIAVAGAVIWFWRSSVPPRIRNAALATGVLMTTPYLGYYDLAVLALPIAWLACEGLETGFRPYEKTTLCAVWLLPLLYSYLLAPWIIMILFVLIAMRARYTSGGPSLAWDLFQDSM